MKRLLLIVIIPIYGVMVFYLGLGIGQVRGRLDTLPSQSEVQEIIGVAVDGVIGAKSREVWDTTIERRVCNEAAMPIMEKFMEDFDRICLNGMEFD